jgi:spore maturation protein CgeB/SAM-dependent methyltransferase
MASDRVTELYRGEIWARETQQACRDRIHWMCAQVTGQRVLDIGCSQGIAALLLGQEGHRVVAVDIDPVAIEFAQRELEKYPDFVKKNVEFQVVVPHQLPFEDASFDTVLLGEVIEHLNRPELMLTEIRRLLRPSGTLVMTTPFGVHPDPGHVRTFYLSGLLRLVDELFRVRELSIVGKYICFAGVAGERSAAADDGHPGAGDLLRMSEEAFRSAELAYLEQLETRRDEISKLSRQATAAETQLANLQGLLKEKTDRLNDQSAQLDESQRVRKELEQNARQMEARLRQQHETITFLNAELALKSQEVRYRLGDAFVQAAASPRGFVLLPYRFVRLFFDGLRRRRERSRSARGSRQRSTAASESGGSAAAGTAVAPARESPAARPGAVASKFEFKAVGVPDRPPRLAVKAAAILDEFTSECFKGELRLIQVTPQDWRRVLAAERPDFLFVESAWKGNGGAWQSQLTRAKYIADSPLYALVDWCQSQNIPTVFWNKEDPPNFEHFIDVAKRFDHIFTTDEQCVERYRAAAGHDRVHAMPFAAQPAIHNPIGSTGPRYGNLCFAGTYYAKRHSDRRGDIDVLLKPALQRGLTIFDRMHDYTQSDFYRFPPEYQDVIHGALPYAEMVDAYKRFRVFLNVNSVKDSPTMFSRRVLELLACGTPVISTYALGIERLLGGDCVALVDSVEDAERWMDTLINSPELRDRMVLLGQRRIFQEHTYEHRVRFMLEKIGRGIAPEPRGVSVVTCTNRPGSLDNVIANYERQAWAEKELVLVLNNDAFVLDDVRRRLESVPNARVVQLPESESLGACLNKAVEESRLPYWTKFDDDNFHAEHFLTDLMSAFVYSAADVVGKCAYYAYLEGPGCLALRFPGEEHRYASFLSGSAMIVARRVFETVSFPGQNVGEDTRFLKDCTEHGFKLYSADRFNYVARRAASPEEHTWRVSDTEYLRKCQVVSYTDDYRPHVVV